jgi:hypothetical protein
VHFETKIMRSGKSIPEIPRYFWITLFPKSRGCLALEGPAQARIQALNLTEGIGAPAMAWLA